MKKYTGVTYDRERHHYVAKVSHKGKIYNCGFHDTEKAAAISRDTAIINNGLDVKLQVLKPVNKLKKKKV